MKNMTKLAPAASEIKVVRLAAYCRVSSGSEDQLHSFAAQIKYYTEYADKIPGGELVDIYADEAVTGTRMDKREEFGRLIRDCKKGKIDRIVVKSVSRFARNTKELLAVIRMLKSIGVSVLFEEQGIDTVKLSNEMILTFPGLAAQKESETISDNMRWSYKKRMESGEFNCCRAAYGFDLIDGELRINETEAAVVRRIFHLYLSGMGKQAIANLLNAEGAPKRYGQDKWYNFSVSYILNNERYMGDALLQKSYTTEVLPYRKVRNHGVVRQIYVENSNPAIIPRETFMAAQKMQEMKKTGQCNRGGYPLSKLIKCPDCGHNFRRQVVNGTAYWLCSYKASGRSDCRCLRLRETDVYAAFAELTEKLTANRPYILGDLLRQMIELRSQTSENQQKTYMLDKQVADLNAQSHVLAQLRTKGILNDAEYTTQTGEINQKVANLRIERRHLTEADDEDEQLEQLRLLDRMLEEYIPTGTFDEELLGQIVDRITTEDAAELTFILIGGLELPVAIQTEKRCIA